MADNNRNWEHQNRNRYREDDAFRENQQHWDRVRNDDYGYSNDSAHGREMENRGGYGDAYGHQQGYRQEPRQQRNWGQQASWQDGRRHYNESPYGNSNYRDSWQREDWGRGNVNSGYGGYSGRDMSRNYGDHLEDDFRRDREMNRYRDIYGSETNYNRGREDRDWWDRTRDKVASWFGDDDAERRTRRDEQPSGTYRGRGPKDYSRSQDRIREDVCDRLTDDGWLDASNIQVDVKGNEVILMGTVESREQKRRAEDLVESISGVRNVENRIKINYREEDDWDGGRKTTQERIRNTKS